MNLKQGMDSVVRVINMLRRKNFEVSDLKVKSIRNEQSELSITICSKPNLGVDQALMQLNKLVDVYNIRGK